MLGLAVQPPPQTRCGVPLYPPVVVRLSSETSLYEELGQTWAVATLVHQSGNILYDRLGGKVADSAHPLPDSEYSYGHNHGHSHNHSRSRCNTASSSSSSREKDRAYFYFPDLVIHEPGRYKIRVSLMEMEYSHEGPAEGTVRVRDTVDTRSIIVDDRDESHSRPNSQERAFLRVLKDDGQEVPSP